MKRIFIAVFAVFMLGVSSSTAFNLKDLFGGSSSSSETATTGDSKSSSGGLLDAIGGFVNNTIANNKFTIDDLVGSWEYTSPAVSFQSDNALKKIGGAGAATALENKLEPYYKQLGFTKTSLVVEKDHSFVLKMGVLTLKGVVEKDASGMLEFSFSAFGKVSLGKVKANATKAGSTLNLTFDATKMIQLLTKVSSVLNNSTLNTLASLLNSYDGVYMGFKLKKK
ncbi:MAG: DUF4923 family protein [Muribaculaceae bacterium]|nr:DUF4923 family protein [Muribaculaceae bacterium]